MHQWIENGLLRQDKIHWSEYMNPRKGKQPPRHCCLANPQIVSANSTQQMEVQQVIGALGLHRIAWYPTKNCSAGVKHRWCGSMGGWCRRLHHSTPQILSIVRPYQSKHNRMRLGEKCWSCHVGWGCQRCLNKQFTWSYGFGRFCGLATKDTSQQMANSLKAQTGWKTKDHAKATTFLHIEVSKTHTACLM